MPPSQTVDSTPVSIKKYLQAYWVLTKPRVTQLAVFCALIGMCLATPGVPNGFLLIAACSGIWLLAAAAFALNCLFERHIDAKMRRTAHRASAKHELSAPAIILFSSVLGIVGAFILYIWVNPLTMWLTIATFVGYAFIYTMLLKPLTPQNIVIGGLSGAMPPALGWAAVANSVPMEAWILVLIIFIWTPPHFWALALYRQEDFAQSGLPMLPITHGASFTRLHIWLYSIALAATTALPFATKMSGWIYLASVAILNILFLRQAWLVYRHYTDQHAKRLFLYSIVYLSLLFAALLLDHYFK